MQITYEHIRNIVEKAAVKAGAVLEQWAEAEAAPESNLAIEAERAQLEWEQARNYFEQVTDPDLIDYAIYNLKAAERRYSYLLKLVRQQTNEVEVI
ncbi:MAG TPA: YaaL family protein [bacterium]|nr:YaaL family protein [bacterium]